MYHKLSFINKAYGDSDLKINLVIDLTERRPQLFAFYPWKGDSYFIAVHVLSTLVNVLFNG